MQKKTYNSQGTTKDANVDDSEACLLPVLEVLALVHVEPENSRETNYAGR